MKKIRSEVLSQGTSLLTFYTPFKRSDKMYQKIEKMIENLEFRGSSQPTKLSFIFNSIDSISLALFILISDISMCNSLFLFASLTRNILYNLSYKF